MDSKIKQQKKYRRHHRVRAKIFGTKEKPRLCVFKSLKHIYAQIINDEKGETLVAASDLELKKLQPPKRGKKTKTQKKNSELSDKFRDSEVAKKDLCGKAAIAFEVGKLIAQKALTKKIKKVVFDRGGSKYHGRIRALADGAREGGLEF